ncbi:uncharacterized protein LOC142414131 [Mycteria americana]|uniref:uncharacterized protein LOC142414131 n=1 Tax=Mycteria americana TaxID=33587 RepID=UPI003F586B4B
MGCRPREEIQASAGCGTGRPPAAVAIPMGAPASLQCPEEHRHPCSTHREHAWIPATPGTPTKSTRGAPAPVQTRRSARGSPHPTNVAGREPPSRPQPWRAATAGRPGLPAGAEPPAPRASPLAAGAATPPPAVTRFDPREPPHSSAPAPPCPVSSCPTRPGAAGTARHGLARSGTARYRPARFDSARPVPARLRPPAKVSRKFPVASVPRPARRPGPARPGPARLAPSPVSARRRCGQPAQAGALPAESPPPPPPPLPLPPAAPAPRPRPGGAGPAARAQPVAVGACPASAGASTLLLMLFSQKIGKYKRPRGFVSHRMGK